MLIPPKGELAMEKFPRKEEEKKEQGIVKKPGNASDPGVGVGDIPFGFIWLLNDNFGWLNDSFAHSI